MSGNDKNRVTAVEDAKKILDEESKKTVDQCTAEIQQILTKYGCRIEVRQQIQVFQNPKV